MLRTYQILLPLFSLFLVRVDLTDLNTVTIPVDILKVYDGDTVLAGHGSFTYKVRLSRIDAPEKGQPYLIQKGDAGAFSKECLKKNLGSKGLLHVYGHDIYGRVLGDIDKVSLKLVQQGCVSLYPYAKFESVHEKFHYLRALKKAQKDKKGLWSHGGTEQPKSWRKKHQSFFKRRTSLQPWQR